MDGQRVGPPAKHERRSSNEDSTKTQWTWQSWEEMEEEPPVEWLVRGYVPTDSLMLVYGKPNSFKSFLVLDWALSLSRGREWLGAATKRAPVLYIMGEGKSGLRKRVNGWVSRYGKPGDIHFINYPVPLTEGVDKAMLKRALKVLQPAFVIVDTVSRCFGVGDENSTQDMRTFVAACDELRTTVARSTFCLVHHTGWSTENNNDKRPRGSIVLHASNDVEFRCERREDSPNFTVHQPRNKEGEHRKPERFAMRASAESIVIERCDASVDPRTDKRRRANAAADTARIARRSGHK